MDTKLPYQSSERETTWSDVVFYLMASLLMVAVFTHTIFSVKLYFQNQKLAEINQKIALYGTNANKEQEKKIINYKKSSDDFSALLKNHTVASGIFQVIEKSTLPDVSFFGIDMSEPMHEVRLSGQAKNMEILSRQIQLFENNADYLENINVIDSKVDTTGKISFVLNLSLNPKIFAYYQ